jgi:polyketide cyclase/dehydrase/lipid transport protein
MPMTDYHFVSSWRLQAPIDQVWEEIFHTERWPSWWRYLHRVDLLDPGDADGLGKRQHLVFTTRLPYRLGFDIQVRRIQPPTTLEADTTGELEGVGRWTLTPADGGTLVRYDWDVWTTRWWMNLAAGRPADLHLEPRRAHAGGGPGPGTPAGRRPGAAGLRVAATATSPDHRLGWAAGRAAGVGLDLAAKARIATTSPFTITRCVPWSVC